MQLKTVGKLLRPFPYEPLNIELIIGLYFDSRIVVRRIVELIFGPASW